jgi:hypothetical protein
MCELVSNHIATFTQQFHTHITLINMIQCGYKYSIAQAYCTPALTAGGTAGHRQLYISVRQPFQELNQLGYGRESDVFFRR